MLLQGGILMGQSNWYQDIWALRGSPVNIGLLFKLMRSIFIIHNLMNDVNLKR